MLKFLTVIGIILVVITIGWLLKKLLPGEDKEISGTIIDEDGKRYFKYEKKPRA